MLRETTLAQAGEGLAVLTRLEEALALKLRLARLPLDQEVCARKLAVDLLEAAAAVQHRLGIATAHLLHHLGAAGPQAGASLDGLAQDALGERELPTHLLFSTFTQLKSNLQAEAKRLSHG